MNSTTVRRSRNQPPFAAGWEGFRRKSSMEAGLRAARPSTTEELKRIGCLSLARIELLSTVIAIPVGRAGMEQESTLRYVSARLDELGVTAATEDDLLDPIFWGQPIKQARRAYYQHRYNLHCLVDSGAIMRIPGSPPCLPEIYRLPTAQEKDRLDQLAARMMEIAVAVGLEASK